MRKQRGYPGHFIAAPWCLFSLHTHVPGFRVSTVGDYRPPHERVREAWGPMRQIGCNRYFETMVFLEEPDGTATSPMLELDTDAYETAEEAEAGHEALVQKYEALTAEEASEIRAKALKRWEPEPEEQAP